MLYTVKIFLFRAGCKKKKNFWASIRIKKKLRSERKNLKNATIKQNTQAICLNFILYYALKICFSLFISMKH